MSTGVTGGKHRWASRFGEADGRSQVRITDVESKVGVTGVKVSLRAAHQLSALDAELPSGWSIFCIAKARMLFTLFAQVLLHHPLSHLGISPSPSGGTVSSLWQGMGHEVRLHRLLVAPEKCMN